MRTTEGGSRSPLGGQQLSRTSVRGGKHEDMHAVDDGCIRFSVVVTRGREDCFFACLTGGPFIMRSTEEASRLSRGGGKGGSCSTN